MLIPEPIILTVFQHGEFTQESARLTSYSLKAYIIGLLGFMLVKVLATGFFSRQDTKTPVKIGIIAMAVNMFFNLILFYPLEHVGLALATAISAIVNATLLFATLYKKQLFKPDARWVSWLVKLLFANLMLVVFIYFFMPVIDLWQSWGTWQRALQMLILIVSSVMIYVVCLLVVGVRVKDLKHA